RLKEAAVLLRRRGVVARRRGHKLEWWNAHRLAGLQPRLRLRALAIHADFAFADDALDMTERKSRKARFEETIDAHAVFIRRDGDGLDTLRECRRGRRACSVILRCAPLARLGG